VILYQFRSESACLLKRARAHGIMAVDAERRKTALVACLERSVQSCFRVKSCPRSPRSG
jgi:hypothetical protein